MKTFHALIAILIGFAITCPEIDARERRGGGGGGGRARTSSSHRSAPAKRSPMTGSRVSRPQSRPAPKQVSRPASRPSSKPATRPAQRPSSRPAQRPSVERPSNRPAQRPSVERPSTRPATRPDGNRPGGKPNINRPDGNRPATLPGMVTYPNRPGAGKPGRPNVPDRGRPDRGGDNRVNIGDRNNLHIDKINVGRRNVGLNRPSTLPARNRDWNNNKWGGNRGVWGNNVNINIDRNFSINNNFSYRPNYWGARPWWGAGSCYGWHHGHWNYGWNSYYYRRHWWYDDNDFARGFMWGIAVWSLGNLIYDMGYQSYSNPYPAPPVQNTYVTYTQPVSVAAAANPPGDEESVKIAEEKSSDAVDRSRTAFKQGDYVTALSAVDEALGYTPGDVTLHEYRALVLFALGKYADAAGVLNPVLASGPGWGWDTMIGFYNESETYKSQLRKLEDYVKGSPGKADGHFLLGYHYMVCGYMDRANEQFGKAAELEPADTISAQLRDLTSDSINGGSDDDAEPPAPPPPVPSEKLVGTWTSKTPTGTVTFTMTDGGDYTWGFKPASGEASQLKGTYGLNDKGLLVLTSDDTQMVSAIEMKDDSKMHFTLIGAPDGDPGLDFTKG